MNNYEIHQGDCLKVLGQLADDSINAIITDPPYSSGGQTSSSRTAMPSKKYVNSGVQVIRPDFFGDNKDQRSFFYWCTLWLSECFRIAKEGSPICLFTDWRQLPITTDAIQAAGFIWRGIVAWNKTEAVRPQKGRFRNQCEYIVWGSKGDMPITRNVKVIPGAYTFPVKQDDKFHLTGKPTELMESIVKIAEPNSTILDPFMGSGTTGVAAIKQGLSFIGIEQSKIYFNIAQSRLEKTQENITTLSNIHTEIDSIDSWNKKGETGKIGLNIVNK
jgi:site-specific DNA-methyltransferase (adenine-specific)